MGKEKLFIARGIAPETADWLKQAGVAYAANPLIKIELCEPGEVRFERMDDRPLLVLLTSVWAAQWLKKHHNKLGFSAKDTLCCISQKQADVLTSLTENIKISVEKNAASLVNLVKSMQPVDSVVYLKGDRSLNTIGEQLKEAGKRFSEAVVYRNIPIKLNLLEAYKLYLFFSPSAVQSFYDAGNTIPADAMVGAIGPITARACESILNRKALVSEIQDELSAVQFCTQLLKQTMKH